ncbi:MAG: hypothetical protein QOE63_556, partial [Acidimicrobiaceae bacterium]
MRGFRSSMLATAVAASTLLARLAVEPANAATAAAQQATPSGRAGQHFVATPVTAAGRTAGVKAPSSRLAQSDPSLLGRSDATPTAVMVKLDYDALATYQGGAGAPATSPSATGQPLTEAAVTSSAYASVVANREANIVAGIKRAVPAATIGRSYRVVYGGVSLVLPANQISALLGVAGVVAVQADSLRQPLTDSSPDFIDAPPVWANQGGQATAGAGVLFGSLDTGIWPEHPSFAANPDLPPAPVRPGPGGGPLTCNYGDNPLTPANDPFVCNNKLVGGDNFLDTYNQLHPGEEVYPTTARDSDGHGTHTSSTAAGDVVANAPIFGIDRGPISGLAPGAWVAEYKVCGVAGCFVSDSVSAVEQAILDGVKVINFSIGGGSDPFTDPGELAFLDAYAAGVFVAASAGNSGPGASTAEHLSPWVTTVGASTQERTFQSTLTLHGTADAQLVLTGSSITTGISSPLPVVMASAAPYSDELCENPAAPGTFTGKIVACKRGGANGRVEKGHNVFLGGASGMILYNPTLADTETDNHWLPTVHLADPTAFLAFMAANPSVTASFTDGTKAVGQGDVMAAFSSRGPGGKFIKPDVTAPGVQILAGDSPTPDEVVLGPPGQYFQAIAGTSMSSPHVAGASLLLTAEHPDWSPSQIKSALMTTATTHVVKEDLTTPADPFDMGAGRIDIGHADDPGLTLNETAARFASLAGSDLTAVNLNIASIDAPVMPGKLTTTRTVTNVGAGGAYYSASATAPGDSAITVSPSSFFIAAGASKTLTVTITSTATDQAQRFGEIDLTAVGRMPLHLPVAFIPTQGKVSLDQSCDPQTLEIGLTSTCTVTATNQSFNDTTVDLTTSATQELAITGATNGATVSGGGAALNDVALSAREPGVPSLVNADGFNG